MSTIVEKMFSIGAQYASSKSRRHPTAKKFIYGTKSGTEIFDLEETAKLLESAKEYVKSLAKDGATVLFVGGKSESIEIVRKAAESINMPYVAGRWIGGTFTNFGEIRHRVEKLIKMKSEEAKGDFAKYTKWERNKLLEEMRKLTEFFGGIEGMEKLPRAIFVIDTDREEIAVAEARKAKIKVVGLMNADCDASVVDFPMFGNDSARKSIEFFVQEIVSAYKEGQALKGK